MGAFEYMLMLVSVVLGLAVSDLAISLHRLLGAGARVRWDALAPLAAAVAFLKIVNQWWAWFATAQIARALTFEAFVLVLIATTMLFLLAAAAFPDEAPEGQIDLAQHYAKVARRYWLLFASELVLMNAIDIWAQMSIAPARFDLVGTLLSPAAAVSVSAVGAAVAVDSSVPRAAVVASGEGVTVGPPALVDAEGLADAFGDFEASPAP